MHSFLCILFSWKNGSFAPDASGTDSGLGGIGIAKAASQSLTHFSVPSNPSLSYRNKKMQL